MTSTNAPRTLAQAMPLDYYCHAQSTDLPDMRRQSASIHRSAAGCGSSRCAAHLLRVLVLAVAIAAWAPGLTQARVLNDGDLERISGIKASFAGVVTDVAQSSQRPDLSSGDSECVKSTLRELLQISDELKSYEYLITIESQLNDFGDDNALKGIVRFAVEKALNILDTQRRRLGQLSDQCSRYAVSPAKTQQAIQFIDGTAAILKSLQPRL
jgi:hypothetical protein